MSEYLKNANPLPARPEIDYRKLLKAIWSKWPWLAGALGCAWITGWVYLRYTPAVYTCRASLKFEESRSEISELLQAKNRFYRQDRIETEKFILRSYAVRLQAVRSLESAVPEGEEAKYPKSLRGYNNEEMADRIYHNLRIEENENDGIIHIKLTDANPHFAVDALNHLVSAYLDYNKTQRSAPAVQTIHFIDTLLEEMQKSVHKTGKKIEEFKVKNSFLDLSSSAEHKALELGRLETEKQQLDLQSMYIRRSEHTLQEYNPEGMQLQGFDDPALHDLNAQLNEMRMKRNAAEAYYKPGSEMTKALDLQIAGLKTAILGNIRMQWKKNQENRRYINRQIDCLEIGYHSLPAIERDYIRLKSAFDVNQKVFNYLSEKKLEARISKAAATPSAFIIDHARASSEIVAPKPVKIYTIASFGGLALGILLIFGMRALNPHILDVETLQTLTDLPVIASISACPDISRADRFDLASIERTKTAFAESIRALRNHLSFMATGIQSRVICISSEISGEGKSLISVNLANAFSLLDKKVIVIATDLRKSKMHALYQTEHNKGLSDYLAGIAQLDKIIFPSAIRNLSFLSSGTTPPNPGELLFSAKMKELISALKLQYDFIILDTAPVGLVADAIPLLKMADINLFIVRAGFSRYRSSTVANRLQNAYGLSNLYLLLNDVKPDFLYGTYYSGGDDAA